jgi:ABC-2 type transport system ATP-binding protein
MNPEPSQGAQGTTQVGEMEPLLVIEHLSKRFGPIVAVDDVSFTLARGEVLGFLGPNGAGKSTTMRMVTGYLAPSAGHITVCGLDLARAPIEVRRRIGYLPEGAPAYGDMTPHGLLGFVAALRAYDKAAKRERIEAMVELLELAGVLHQPIETLSKGFKRRVGLAVALLHDPEVLILDEPTDGLDPNQKHHVRGLLQEMAKDKAIIISTHLLEEVDAVCTRAIVIAKGRIVVDAKPAELEARSSYHNAVTLRLPVAQLERARGVVAAVEGVARTEDGRSGAELAELIAFPLDHAEILDPVCRAIEQDGLAVNEVFVERGRLDEVFRRLTHAA